MLKLDGIAKRLSGRNVLVDVGFCVEEGGLLVLTGPSGGGKTTLLRIIAGLDVPDAGTIDINGTVCTNGVRMLVSPFDRSVGMVFQDFALWPHMTVEGNISYALRHRSSGRAADIDALGECLRTFDVEHLRKKHPGSLSGGERQRVALARAFAPKPRLLLLDEPVSNVDRRRKIEILQYLEKYRAANSTTVVYVTHSLSDMEYLNAPILILEDCRVRSA